MHIAHVLLITTNKVTQKKPIKNRNESLNTVFRVTISNLFNKHNKKYKNDFKH